MITCPKCDKSFKNEHGLNIHTYLKHSTKKRRKMIITPSIAQHIAHLPSACPVCGFNATKVIAILEK